ncbi:hypothetical protein ACIQI7_09115 [Kitasatospora sp. NPDC092039]|uniref:hypothetical protein n=1 Tax=Kitasatospora sp. NPDC092039 TaxID=3364086 RepID=UPI00381F6DA2
MPEQYRVLSAVRINVGPTQCWAVRQQRPDGEHHITLFPASSLEWRAAEYDIDHTTPAGIDQILDILLHEPFVPDPLENRDTDPAAAKGLTAPATQAVHGLTAGDTVPITLHNAPDRATARQAHLERIAHIKRTRVAVTAGPAPGKLRGAPARAAPDPLDEIRRNHGITSHGVAAKVELVEQARQQLARPQPSSGSTTARSAPEDFTTSVWDAAVPRRDEAQQRDGDDTA